MKFRASPKSPSPRDLEMLSAYLDGHLNARDQAHLNSRLQEEPALKTLFEELTATRQLLRKAPVRRAPRSFVLTPRMIGIPPRTVQRQPPRAVVPALSFVSVLASLAFVAVIVGEMLGLGSLLPLQMTSQESAVEQFTLEMEAPLEKAPPVEQAQETVVAGAQLAEESLPLEAPVEGTPSEATGELRKALDAQATQPMPTLTDGAEKPTPEESEGFPQVAQATLEATPIGLGGGEVTQTITSVEEQRAATATSTISPTPSAMPTPSLTVTPLPSELPLGTSQPESSPTAVQVEVVQDETPSRLPWRYIEVGLVIIAVFTALGAIYLHRRWR